MAGLERLQDTLKNINDKLYTILEQAISKIGHLYSVETVNAYRTVIRAGISSIIEKILQQSPEKIFIYILDVMFSPNLVLRQVVLILCLQFSMIGGIKLGNMMVDIVSIFTAKGRKLKQLRQKIQNSQSFEEWKNAANELDRIYGYDKWRTEDYCPFIDYKSVSKRMRDTIDMMNRGDIFNLMFRLRGGLARDQFGIQHEGLFTRARAGTKLLVERYHSTMSAALDMIADTPYDQDQIPTDAKLAFFNETRHAFGRTALLLSGGAYMGYYHLGVIKALYERNLLPRVISGASAGSLMAAAVGTMTDEEFMHVRESRESMSRFCLAFFKYSNRINSETGRWIQYHTPRSLRWVVDPLLSMIFDKKIINLDSEYFKSVVIDLVGHWTFQEAFDRTGRIINITVAPMNDYDPPRLLNYLTAPHVCVWSAAAASCALPGMFDSFSLIVKEPNGNYSPENIWTRRGGGEHETKAVNYSDGSLENDLPMKQLSELFNVSHFIVSQVNPHSALLSSLSLHTSVWSPAVYGAIVSYIKFLLAQFRDWVKNVSNLLVSRSLAPVWSSKRGITQMLTQEYEGRLEDITIFPWKNHLSVSQAFMSILKNPTKEEFYDAILAGERQTWPLITRIQVNSSVELTLDRCVQRLRRRIAEENNSRPQMMTGFKTIDRTPSFYTSRSIVNMSGLSVSDPIPVDGERGRNSNGYKSPTMQYGRAMLEAEDSLVLNVPSEDIPLAGDSGRYDRHFGNMPEKNGNRTRKRSHSNPIHFNKGALPKEFHRSSISSNDSTPGMYLTDDIEDDYPENQELPLHEMNKVTKTTSMANFYYRENVSDESLSRTKSA